MVHKLKNYLILTSAKNDKYFKLKDMTSNKQKAIEIANRSKYAFVVQEAKTVYQKFNV